MPNLLVAGNSTNGGTAITTDTSGTLNIVTGSGSGSNAITIDASQNVAVNGNMSFNSGYGSAAVAYGCRAWVNFNGTGTVAIRASGNVTSITDNGTGDYTVNLTTAMPDVNYAVSASAGFNGVGYGRIAEFPTNTTTPQTTSSIRGVTYTANGATTLTDVSVISVSVFR